MARRFIVVRDAVVFTVICLISVFGLFTWWTRSSSPVTLAGGAEARKVEPSETQAKTRSARAANANFKPGAAQKAERISSQMPGGAIEDTAANAPDAPVAGDTVFNPQSTSHPFPAGEKIFAGSRGDSITFAYGDPSLFAVTSTERHLVETYVYAKDRGKVATVIQLRDGMVSGAYSKQDQPAPAGLSTPRRWGK